MTAVYDRPTDLFASGCANHNFHDTAAIVTAIA
jgi:hypothetical protein